MIATDHAHPLKGQEGGGGGGGGGLSEFSSTKRVV